MPFAVTMGALMLAASGNPMPVLERDAQVEARRVHEAVLDRAEIRLNDRVHVLRLDLVRVETPAIDFTTKEPRLNSEGRPALISRHFMQLVHVGPVAEELIAERAALIVHLRTFEHLGYVGSLAWDAESKVLTIASALVVDALTYLEVFQLEIQGLQADGLRTPRTWPARSVRATVAATELDTTRWVERIVYRPTPDRFVVDLHRRRQLGAPAWIAFDRTAKVWTASPGETVRGGI